MRLDNRKRPGQRVGANFRNDNSMSNTIDEARQLIQKRWKHGDDQAAAVWIAEKYGMRFNRVSTRQFRLNGGSRHHAHFFIEAYNAVQRARQKRQSRIKKNDQRIESSRPAAE